MGIGKKVFTLKTFGADLHKWSPSPTTKQVFTNNTPYYCTAAAGSQGEDWITSYCYSITVINGKQGNSAYVECDYVQ